jgi:hypothetical protein
MTCKEIENRLPAYQDGLMPPEEHQNIEEHLASCPRCRRAFEDLQRMGQLVGGLDEVEPPPFFEQRIMSRVREEAGQKKGIIQRLFYPLRIKVPIQALATIVIAVLAFYVYHAGDPELQQIAPFPVPAVESETSRTAAESPKGVAPPPEASPSKQAPAGDSSKKEGQPFAAPLSVKDGKEERRADLQTPMREGRPMARPSADTASALMGKEALSVGAEASGQAQPMAGKPEADRTSESLLQKQKGETADRVAETGGSRKTISAPSPSRMKAAVAVGGPVTELTIQVEDMDAAIREIHLCLDRINALIIEKQHLQEGEFLKAEIAARNFAAFLELIGRMGRINLEKAPAADQEGHVTVQMKIVRHL